MYLLFSEANLLGTLANSPVSTASFVVEVRDILFNV